MAIYPEIGRQYRHYKGGLYEVISLATHTETNEVLVVYKSIHFGSVFARPLSMWFDKIEDDIFEGELFRFELVSNVK